MKKRTCDACGEVLVRNEFLHTIIVGPSGSVDWAEPGWECPRCGETWTDREMQYLDQQLERMRQEDLAAQRQME